MPWPSSTGESLPSMKSQRKAIKTPSKTRTEFDPLFWCVALVLQSSFHSRTCRHTLSISQLADCKRQCQSLGHGPTFANADDFRLSHASTTLTPIFWTVTTAIKTTTTKSLGVLAKWGVTLLAACPVIIPRWLLAIRQPTIATSWTGHLQKLEPKLSKVKNK